MLFCKSSVFAGNTSGIGLVGDCATIIVVGLGCAWVIIFQVLVAVRTVREDSSLQEPLFLPRRSDSDNSEKHPFGLTGYKTKAIELVGFIEACLAIGLFVIGYVYSLEGCTTVSFYLTYGLRVICWFIVALNTKASFSGRNTPVHLCLGWSITQVVTGGMNCVHESASHNPYYAALSLLYLILAMITTATWGVQLFKSNDPNELGCCSSASRSWHIGSPFQSGFCDKKMMTWGSKSSRRTNEGENQSSPLTADVPSLWLKHTSLIPGLGGTDNSSRATSRDMVDIRLSFCSTDSDDLDIEKKQVDLGILIQDADTDDRSNSRTTSRANSTNANNFSSDSHTFGSRAGRGSTGMPSGAASSSSSASLLSPTGGHGLSSSYGSAMTSASSSSWLTTSRLREQVLAIAGDITVNVWEVDQVTVNNKAVVVYKLGIGENASIHMPTTQSKGSGAIVASDISGGAESTTRTVRLVLKRLDEIVFLRDKILCDYPHITDIGPVPRPSPGVFDMTGSGAQAGGSQGAVGGMSVAMARSRDYEMHRKDMKNFLEMLLTHPVASRVAVQDLRGSAGSAKVGSTRSRAVDSSGHRVASGSYGANATGIQDTWSNEQFSSTQASISSSNAGSSANRSPGEDNDAQSAAQVSLLFPMLWANEASISVDVSGWVDIQTSRREFKIFYDVVVHCRDHSWTLRKRYRQFRALHKACEAQGLLGDNVQRIQFPVKGSQKRKAASGLEREEKGKLDDNALGLDAFVKSLIYSLRPIPPLLLAFLESDLRSRSSGYDVIKSINGNFELLRTNENSYLSRKANADKLDKYMSQQAASNAQATALNMTVQAVTGNRMFGLLGNNQKPVDPSAQLSQGAMSAIGQQDNDNVDVRLSISEDQEGGDQILAADDDASSSNDNEDVESTRGSVSVSGSIGGGGTSKTAKRLGTLGRGSVSDKNEKIVGKSTDSGGKSGKDSLLSVPAAALADLIALLQVFKAQELAASCNGMSDFLPLEYSMVLDCQAKPLVKATSAATQASQDVSATKEVDASRGTWISQWRIRKAVSCTTAFADILNRLHGLKDLNLRDVKNLTEEDKMSFLLNLYNVMSLHGSILVQWPAASREGRTEWARALRYRVGSQYISLLQLEHAVLRARSQALTLPSLPGCPDVPIPTAAEVKGFSSFFLDHGEPRISFAMALPHRTSPVARVYKTGAQVSNDLRTAAAFFLTNRVSVKKRVVSIPKVMRLYLQDFATWRDNTNATAMAIADVTGSHMKKTDLQMAGSVGADRPKPSSNVSSPQKAGHHHNQDNSESDWDVARGLVGDWRALGDSNSSNLFSSQSTAPLIIPGIFSTFNTPQPQQTALAQAVPAAAAAPAAVNCGDVMVSESELQRLARILKIGVDVRDRKWRMRTYKSCFLGSDAVRCVMASGEISTPAQAEATCDQLIEYGFIRHSTGDHWMKSQELFYAFTGYDSPQAQLSPYFAFLMGHTDMSDMRKQLQVCLDEEDPVQFLAEDYSFAFPI